LESGFAAKAAPLLFRVINCGCGSIFVCPMSFRNMLRLRELCNLAGEDVTVEDEVVVIKCIVLPHKLLNSSVLEEIIL
jgi:hypothetical protein